MRSELLTLGVLLVALGCGSGNNGNGDGGDGGGMVCNGSLSVGDPCNAADTTCAACSGPHQTCLSKLTLGNTSIPLTQNYCSNTSCDPTSNPKTCGTNGTCADLAGDMTYLCYEHCVKGGCRSSYNCFTTPNDPSGTATMNMPTDVNICLPSSLSQCDPTKSMQCSTIFNTMTSTITNGAQYGGCVRQGPDNVGLCEFLPCNIGPNNCPPDPLSGSPMTCLYLSSAQVVGGLQTDVLQGQFCVDIPPTAMQVKVGGTCTSLNDCVDNAFCYSATGMGGTCVQNCYQGTQLTFKGGNPMYENAATPCPNGKTCTDIYKVGGANYPGACQ